MLVIKFPVINSTVHEWKVINIYLLIFKSLIQDANRVKKALESKIHIDHIF